MNMLYSLTSPSGLRKVLWFDAVTGVGTGAIQLSASGLLAGWLGLPVALLQGSGLAIFAFVALAAWLALQPSPSRAGLTVIVVCNFAWALGCLALVFGGAAGLTALGVAYLMVQAIAVLVLAELQWMGLKRLPEAVMA
ncbi:MAG: hypothetical protein ACK40L_02995 [Hydrogenophaga sp.]|nr:hypothetical protein [Hydrogenophaga sp.]